MKALGEVPNSNTPLSHRALSMLRAVRDGRAQLACSCEPDLYVDGLPCCDQAEAHTLVRLGLIRAVRPGLVGEHVGAAVTARGFEVLATNSVPAAG